MESFGLRAPAIHSRRVMSSWAASVAFQFSLQPRIWYAPPFTMRPGSFGALAWRGISEARRTYEKIGMCSNSGKPALDEKGKRLRVMSDGAMRYCYRKDNRSGWCDWGPVWERSGQRNPRANMVADYQHEQISFRDYMDWVDAQREAIKRNTKPRATKNSRKDTKGSEARCGWCDGRAIGCLRCDGKGNGTKTRNRFPMGRNASEVKQ